MIYQHNIYLLWDLSVLFPKFQFHKNICIAENRQIKKEIAREENIKLIIVIHQGQANAT